MNLLLIADVGGSERHTGDEALLEVALHELAGDDVTFTLVANGHLESTRRTDLHLVSPIGFVREVGSTHDAARETLLHDVVEGRATDTTAAGVIAAVAKADAVVLVGGGNLSYTWPHLFYERIALLKLAARAGIPTVVCGQTIGPMLTARQREHVRDALGTAAYVGVRDLPSLQLITDVGVRRAAVHVDDAIALASEPLHLEPHVALAFHQYHADSTQVVHEVARLARTLHSISGLPVALVPNTASTDEHAPSPANDLELAMLVAGAIGDPATAYLLEPRTAGGHAAALRSAAAVVSTRFHPLVFALAAGVPCMAVVADQYTGVKLSGVLRHAGMSGWQLPTDCLATDAPAELFAEMWANRAALSAHLAAITPVWFQHHRQRWDAIRQAVGGDMSALQDIIAAPQVQSPEIAPHTKAAALLTAQAAIGHTRLATAQSRFDEAEEYALSLAATLRERDREIEEWKVHHLGLSRATAALEADRDRLDAEVIRTRDALRAANELSMHLATHGAAPDPLYQLLRTHRGLRPARWVFRQMRRIRRVMRRALRRRPPTPVA